MTGQFTGRHMATILVVFFGAVIAINVAMARFAISTFGGEVVENSYVASQHFNRWLGEAAMENSLGWDAAVSRTPDHHLSAAISGVPGSEVRLVAVARHPLGRLPHRTMQFRRDAKGKFVSRELLPAGRWRLRLEVTAGSQTWRREQDVF